MTPIKNLRPSPAIAVAVLALVAAVAGTALAAPSADTSASAKKIAKDAQRLAKQNKKAIRSIELTRGPAGTNGSSGSNGASGATGAKGNAGQAGSDAASAPTARIVGLGPSPPPGSTEEFGAPSGHSTPAGKVGTATTLSPNVDIVARDLTVKLTVAPGGTVARTFSLVDDGVATGVSCQISAATKTCNSAGKTHTIGAGSEIAIQVSNSGGLAAPADALIGWRATAP